MDPVTWIMIASAILSAGSAVVQGQQQKAVAEYNATLAEQQAKQEELAAQENLRREREENKAILSRQRAIRAKSGVSVDAGSSLLVAARNAAMLEQRAIERSRMGSASADALRQEAGFLRVQGGQAQSAGFLNAGASLLQGASGLNYGAKSKQPSAPKNSNATAFSIYDTTRIA